MAKDKRRLPEVAVCHKNDELILEIEDMGAEGEGIGRADGYALFVKDALVGDVVRVRVMKTRKHFGYAKLLQIVKASPYRIEPRCPVARQCGGCQLQHCSYEKQLQWKQEKVVNNLRRIGGFDMERVSVEPIMGMQLPYYYRNKSQYPVGYDKDGKLIAGFYAGRTHQIIPCRNCDIADPSNQLIVDVVLDYMRQHHITAYNEKEHEGLVRHIMIRVGKGTGQIMVCLVINGKSLPDVENLSERLRQINPHITSICLNRNEADTNVIMGEEIIPIYGDAYIEDCIGDLRFRLSPLSFYQVNHEQTKRLYETAMEYADLQGTETVWDLYCGIGTISLFLSQKADRVFGVEIVPQAIEDAKVNAKLNDITNAEFFVGAAEEVVPGKYRDSGETLRADVVVLDPPRKGCDEKLLQTVIQMQPERIVYVSCDSATLARDAGYLGENGYELKRVRACDMFGMSYHVETVCVLSKPVGK